MSTTATPATGPTNTNDTRGRFVWHELMTTDTAAAEKFYKDVVGWGVTASDMPGMPGMKYTMWTAGEIPIGGLVPMMPNAVAMNAPPNWTCYIEVPNVDETVKQAASLGAKTLVPAMDIPDVGRFAVLQDPQGAVFSVITSATQASPETDPAPKTFSWHEVTTNDLGSTVQFYEALFGWKKQGEYDMGQMGMYHMFGRDRFTYGGMMQRNAEMPPPSWLHYVMVDSADAAVERAKRGGGSVILPPMEVPGGDRIAVLMDPQGAAFAVHSKGSN
jgi:predicted enzyme related to lactoylglutathione lyase